MTSIRALAFLLLLGALLALLPASVEPSCVGSGRMSTSNMVVDVDGDLISLWSTNNGERVLNFYNITMNFITIASNMVQEMNFADNFTCTVTTGTETLYPNATVDKIVLNYTSSAHPDMSVLMSFYVTDLFFEILPSDNRTYVDDGQVYEWTFDPEKLRFTVDLQSFPFIEPDVANGSYVLIIYSYALSVEDVIVFTWDEPYYGGTNVTHSNGASMTWNTGKGGLYDGVPVLIADKDTIGTINRSGPTPITFTFPPALATFPLCAETHYRLGIYESTFVTHPAHYSNQTSSGCSLPSPGTAFTCQGRDWVSVAQEELNLPPSSSTIVIGNLIASHIHISSLSTAINVTGCITSSTGDSPSITVSLTESDLKKIDENGGSLTRQLISQSSSCAPVSYISVDTSTIKSCKKVKTDQVATSGIAATFTLDSSKCRVWWIVVVSVVCGVVLVAVVIVVLLVAFSKRVRYTILPFSKPKTTHTRRARG